MPPGRVFGFEFFSSPSTDPCYGEGQNYLGTATFATDGIGNADFAIQLPVAVTPGQFISLSAASWPRGWTKSRMFAVSHYCHICGRSRANEKFTGRGHREHVCKDCQRIPREERDRLERLDELYGFLDQSNISEKNLRRLEVLRAHPDPEVAKLAGLIEDVARVLPGKRKRWLKLAQRHRPLFDRAIGLLGVEFFEDLLAGYGDFESPLWRVLEGVKEPIDTPVRPAFIRRAVSGDVDSG